MTIFRLFTVLPEFDPSSDNPLANRSRCDSLEAAKLLIARCSKQGEGPYFHYPDSFRLVLKELTGMELDADAHCAVAQDSTRQRLLDLPDDVCAALGVVVCAANCERGKIFRFFKELQSLRVLCALDDVKEEIVLAATCEEYNRFRKSADEMILAQVEAAPKGRQYFVWFDETSKYDFPVDSSDDGPYTRPSGLDIRDLDGPWFWDAASLHKLLLERRNTLAPPLYPVPETALGTVDGVPVTGHLLFDPDALLPIRPIPHRRTHYGMFTILRFGGKTIPTSSCQETRDGLMGVCRFVHFLAKEKEGGRAVCLITGGHSSLNSVIFCVTATADHIQVSDYRAAWEDFAAAVEQYLM